ncbi:uncharacterized protein LOC123260650 isoform X1 [Cotesia glomerata]|uniref:uncharacterized protein LOC123260650 isoform X1 n=1 Tax=Cotesia glomerata TaxID=32391 RepID=UPI001D029309|nr:uncharacterized protein LOC123260650 isoform X1 [Cotesia glomerata]
MISQNSSLNVNNDCCTSGTSILIADAIAESRDDNSTSDGEDTDISNSDSSSDGKIDVLSDVNNSDQDTNDSDNDINDNNDDFDVNHEENIEDDQQDSEFNQERSSIIQSLYENSTRTTDESVLMVPELYIRHKLTKACLNDVLKLLQNLLPEENQLPKTVFQLFSYVHQLAPPLTVIKNFFCKKCLCYNGFNTDIENCSSCLALKEDVAFFFEIDVHDQIKYMFQHRNLAEKLIQVHLRYDGNITDITDGSEYIRVNSRVNRQKYDLTLVLNTDGLSLVKSSTSHCWPLMFFIAELPEYLRELYLTTVGLWYDKDCKPVMNTFLEPFITKFKKCFNDGILWTHPKTGEKIISRIVVPLIIADAPARAQLQNILNFNGRYGCNICEIKSRKCLAVAGKKRIRIYKFEEAKLRTRKRIKHQVLKVMNSDKKKTSKGIKGNSILSRLPLIDMGTCFVPEYMHSVLLEVVRQFISLWLEKKNPWKLRKDLIDEIDEFLLNIRPLYFFGRMPRRLSSFKHYKASEFYNWVLFYSLPALLNKLPV